MKAFYLTGSIIFTVLILIIAFENIAAECSGLQFLFYSIESSPTIIILGLTVVGIITGALYHAFISKVLSTTEEEDDGSFE